MVPSGPHPSKLEAQVMRIITLNNSEYLLCVRHRESYTNAQNSSAFKRLVESRRESTRGDSSSLRQNVRAYEDKGQTSYHFMVNWGNGSLCRPVKGNFRRHDGGGQEAIQLGPYWKTTLALTPFGKTDWDRVLTSEIWYRGPRFKVHSFGPLLLSGLDPCFQMTRESRAG